MRILIAPDSFGGSLSGPLVAEAIAAGWRRVCPADELSIAPLSDGGPGFVDVLASALPLARRVTVDVEDPLGRVIAADFLLSADTAFIESAAACGLHLLAPEERDPQVTTTYGVGQLVAAALDAGVSRIAVGLGGSATNDGGAGMLSALGIARLDRHGERLRPGGGALAGVHVLDGMPDRRLAYVDLVAASDVDAPLLGLYGASNVFGPQKGADRNAVQQLDLALTRWADVLEPHLGVSVRDRPGAGAAGGLGAALLSLGATFEPGIALVHAAIGLRDRMAKADLVITGEGSFDAQSLMGKVVSGVAALAGEHAVPCLVVAGQVHVGRREAAAAGVEQSYSLTDHVGLEAAMAEPAAKLADLAAHIAGQWSGR